MTEGGTSRVSHRDAKLNERSAGFRVLALITAAVAYVEIVLGGTVRATGAGEACPDWPTCHGQVIPPLNGLVLIEYSHRLTASLVSVLVIALLVASVWVWRQPTYMRVLAGISVALLVTQVLLGALTVLLRLPPQIVTAHLATATALLGVLTSIAAYAVTGRPSARSAGSRRLSRAAMAVAGATFLLVLSGSYVVGSNAGLACHTWPLCNGELIPMGGVPAVDISFLHRMAVLVAGLALLAAGHIARVQRRQNPAAFLAALSALAIYAVQVLIGAGNVWLGLAAGVRVAHLAAAQALWVATVTLSVLAVTGWRAARPAAEIAVRRPARSSPSPDRQPRFGDRVRTPSVEAERDKA